MFKVLWIEDSAFLDLEELSVPVYMSGKYDLTIALDASEGHRNLIEKEFDVVVVDLRIPPGEKKEWIELYTNSQKNKIVAKLGLHLLYTFLGPKEKQPFSIKNKPSWIISKRFGIFTVERKLDHQNEMKELEIKVFREKTGDQPSTILVDIINEILFQGK